MTPIRTQVLEILENDMAAGGDPLFLRLNEMVVRHGGDASRVILSLLASLELDGPESMRLWREIGRHYRDLCRRLQRSVSIQTAVCDYLCSIDCSLKNPKIVDARLFERTVEASRHDHLTGLLNRSSMDELLAQEVARSRRYDKDLSLIFFDLDDFKTLNDTFGHQTGDRALKAVASVIQREKRLEDIAARYGGEEIVLILPETAKLNTLVVAERIRKGVRDLVLNSDGRRVPLAVSGGVASFPVNATTAGDLLKCADDALYRAKGSGKNTIAFYTRDKRRYLRVSFEQEIRIRKLDMAAVPPERGFGKNISIGGLLFEVARPFDIGTTLELQLPEINGETLLVIGNVVRVERFAPDCYDIGISISFLDMDKSIKKEIAHWLKGQRTPT